MNPDSESYCNDLATPPIVATVVYTTHVDSIIPGDQSQQSTEADGYLHITMSSPDVSRSPIQAAILESTDSPPGLVHLRRNTAAEGDLVLEKEETHKSTGKDVAEIIIAVALCMLFVVGSVHYLRYYTQRDNFLLFTPFHELSSDDGTKLWHAAANAVIVISVIVLMTCLLVKLFQYECYKIITVWINIGNFLVLFGLCFEYLCAVLATLRVPVDFITFTVFIWNFGCTGLVCIKGHGPWLLQSAYLVAVSALMALMLIRHLPDWTTFAFLVLLSLWDTVNVLWRSGPLRRLDRMLQDRGREIYPGLLFTGIQLGLGDIVSYSVLVGKVSSYGHWISTLACCAGTLIGLCITLSLLSVRRNSLPGLPVWICLGLLLYFISRTLVW